LLIGNGTAYVLATLTGTTNQITVTNGMGTITLSTPQNIHTTASPTFTAVNIGSTNTAGQAVPGSRSLTITQESGGNITITNTGTAQDLTSNRTWALGWSGSLVVTRGGTGLTSIASGAMLYASASNTLSALSIGTAGKILRSTGTAPEWWPSSFAGEIPFIHATTGLTQGTLYWDNTSKILTLTNSSSSGTISQTSAHVMTLYPGANDGTIRLGGTGATFTNVLPGRSLGASLGSATDRFLTIHAAELQVQTLVAADTLATTGGRVIVAYSTKLINTVTDVATVIQVEHNNLSLNDFVMFEARGKTEHMKIGTHGTPDAGKIYKTVAGGFEYAVTRDMDKTGANQWEKGDALVNTGVGFIEMFSEWGASGVPLDYIYNYNNTGTAFSANYSNSTAWSPFGDGANTEINDAVYFGQSSGGAGSQWSNLYFYIGTAAVYSATIVWEFWNGTAWTAFTPTVTGSLLTIGWVSVEWTAANLTGWAANTINSSLSFWVRMRISAFTSFTTLPLTGKFRVYSRKKNVGPTIVGNVRNGSTNFNDWTEHWAIGNLNGLYGYGTDTFGVGLGKYGTTYATLDSTNGYSFYNSETLVSRWDASGNITVGPVSTLTSNVYISAGKIQLRKNTTTLIELDSTGATAVINVGETTTGKSRVNIDSTNGIRMISNIGGTDREFARWHLDGSLRIGEIANSVSRVEIASGALNFITRVSAVDYTSGSISAAGAWTIGRVANSTSRVTIDATNGIQIINQSAGGVSTTLGQWDISGNLILGKVAAASNNMIFNGTTLEFRNNTTVLGSLNASVWTLGISTAQKVTIDTNGVKLYSSDGSTVLGEFAATTKLGIQTGKHVEISAANGIEFYDSSTLKRAVITSTAITMGDPTAGTNTGTNTYITDSYVALRKGTTDVIRLNTNGSGFVSTGKFTWDTAGNVTLLGTINATGGYIGTSSHGWNIGSTGITANGDGVITIGTMKFGNSVASTNNGLYVNANNYLYTTGNFKLGSSTSYISGTGGTSLNITVASTDSFSLTAGNLSIVSGAANTANITVGSASNAGGLNSAGASGDVIFWGGSTFLNKATAPFRVTAAGALTATSGAIAGWSINDTKIYKTNAVISSDGYVSFGGTPPTAYGANVGAWFGYDTSLAKMSLYASTTNYLQWDGAKLLIKAANFTLDSSGNLTAASATITGTINATAGTFINDITVGTASNAGVLKSHGKAAADSGVGFWLSGAANGTSALFDLRSENYFFKWNGTTLTYTAANTSLDGSGNFWTTGGGFGGTAATPKVFIDGDGLFLKDGSINRVFLREDGDLWLDQSTQKTPITVPNFSFETAGTPVANWATLGTGGTLTRETGAGNFTNGVASLKLVPSSATGMELISSVAYSPGAVDYVITFDYKSAYNQELVTTPSRFYIKIVSTAYAAVGTTNVIKTFELPIGTNQIFTNITLGFTTAADFKVVFGTKLGTGTGSVVGGYIDNVVMTKYIPAIELSKYGLMAYTSDANYVKVGIGGLEIKGGSAAFDNLVVHGDLMVYGTQTVFVTGNGLSGTTSPAFTVGTTTTPGGANISLQYGTSAHYLRLNTSSQFDISGVLNWPSGNSTQANTAYAHSQETTGAVHGATDANTASKIVRRDGSGNFAAGTITAALTGNASTASAWATGRTITLTGNVTGVSGSWTGSGNISFATSIAALAVTDAMLAGSISNGKLLQITQADKVSGSAITTGNIDTSGNININTNTSMFKFMGVPINTTYTVDYAVGSGIAENAVLDIASASATWTSDPGAAARRYQAGANRMLVFVDGRLMRKGTGNDYLECNAGGTEITSGTGQYIKFLFDVYSGGTITLVVFAV
jgi:hypothetical protein